MQQMARLNMIIGTHRTMSRNPPMTAATMPVSNGDSVVPEDGMTKHTSLMYNIRMYVDIAS